MINQCLWRLSVTTITRFCALTFYLFGHERQHCWLTLFLFAFGILLLNLVHAQYALVKQGIVTFCALWSFIQLSTLTHSINDDFRDGTFDWLISEGYSIYGYALARGLVFCLLVSLPILLIQAIGFYGMQLDTALLFGLLLNHLHGAVSLLGIQIILCLTAESPAKITGLFVSIPFWIPSFLYVVGMVDDSTALFPLAGLFCFQLGVSLILMHNAFCWRCS